MRFQLRTRSHTGRGPRRIGSACALCCLNRGALRGNPGSPAQPHGDQLAQATGRGPSVPFKHCLVGVGLRKPGAHTWEPGGPSSAPTRFFPCFIFITRVAFEAFAMLRCLPPFGQYPREMLSEGECEYIGMCTRSMMYIVNTLIASTWLKVHLKRGVHVIFTFVFAEWISPSTHVSMYIVASCTCSFNVPTLLYVGSRRY